MTKNQTPDLTIVTDEITEGERDYRAYAKKLAKDKLVRRVVFAVGIAGAVALSLKYISTPVDQSELTEEMIAEDEAIAAN